MKTVGEYLQEAMQFERMAAEAGNVEFKALLLKQAKAYRKLAEEKVRALDPPQ
jgi:hypothetical protein